jgi:threonine synthase
VGAIQEKDFKTEDDFALIGMLKELSGLPLPGAVKEIMDAEILHDTVCEKDKMKSEVEKALSL